MPTVRHLAECCLGRHADSVAHQSTPQLSTRLQLQHPRQLQRCHSRLTLRTHFAVVSPSRCMPSQFTLSPLQADQRLPGMGGLDQETVIVPARVGPPPPAASLKVTPQICQLFCFYRCLTSQSNTMTRLTPWQDLRAHLANLKTEFVNLEKNRMHRTLAPERTPARPAPATIAPPTPNRSASNASGTILR